MNAWYENNSGHILCENTKGEMELILGHSLTSNTEKLLNANPWYLMTNI